VLLLFLCGRKIVAAWCSNLLGSATHFVSVPYLRGYW
jgi:hypothetical protein